MSVYEHVNNTCIHVCTLAFVCVFCMSHHVYVTLTEATFRKVNILQSELDRDLT